MSVQFGRWHYEGAPPAPHYLEKVRMLLVPYGPDGSSSYSVGGVDILYSAFHTTKESRSETQPYIARSGAVITWDGRLDNRSDFIARMSDVLQPDSPDVQLVAGAYDLWGTRCFERLSGDWAVSVWDPVDRSLTLAKDPIGTRPLYYSVEGDQISWSTILEPLVLLAGKQFALSEEYLAGWFSLFPAAHLTPYVGIEPVPPSCFVRLEKGRQTVSKYWDFDPARRIRYLTDGEYEEQFRSVFAQAVERRLRSDAPVLAELSGGVDSSSIVCVADGILARGAAWTPRLDTLSYYNDSEPNWNERPYFARVEEKRGRTGCHIDLGTPSFEAQAEPNTFRATPGSGSAHLREANRQFAQCLTSQGNRVVLSGTGGDEVTGGVPTPTPELMDLLAEARFGALAHKLKLWALDKRKPWFHLLFEAARGFVPPAIIGVPELRRPTDWLLPHFVKRYRAALTGYPSQVRLFGPLPTFQENIAALGMLRRQLACTCLASNPPYEKRYPYLDRDLLEFLYAIPREQLVRPGQRRSLVRRALEGTIPKEILNRKRKAFVIRSPMVAIATESARLIAASSDMWTVALEMVDAKAFSNAVERVRQGQEVRIVAMKRTLDIESWLRSTGNQGLLIGARELSPTVLHGAASDLGRPSRSPQTELS